MSQAKVDKYKQEKANRKQTVAKQKVKSMIAKVCASVVGIALAAWIVVSGVLFVIDNRPVKKFFVKLDAVENYLEALTKDETEDTSKKEDSTEKEESTDKEESTEKADSTEGK